MKRQQLWTFAILFALTLNASAKNDLQAWQWLTANLWKNDSHRVYFYADNRIAEDASRDKVHVIGPRYKYKFNDSLDLGLGYVYINVKNLNRDEWNHQNRFEFEFNPKFKLSDTLTLKTRNRLELRALKGKDSVRYRTRHRLHVGYKMPFKIAPKGYSNSELFYDYYLGKISENRLIPIGLSMKLTNQVGLNLFYMIQSKRTSTSDRWDHNHIIGTHFKLKF